MQAKQQVSHLEEQQVEMQQRVQTVQAAFQDQNQLLQRERAAFGQSAELAAMKRLEEDVSRAQEVLANIQACTLVFLVKMFVCGYDVPVTAIYSQTLSGCGCRQMRGCCSL